MAVEEVRILQLLAYSRDQLSEKLHEGVAESFVHAQVHADGEMAFDRVIEV